MARTANTASGSSAPPAPSARRSSRCSRSAGSRRREVRPLASARSAGSKVELRRLRARGAGADRRVDPGPRPDPLLRGRQGELRVGAEAGSRPARWSSTTPATGACTTTCRWSSPQVNDDAVEDHNGLVANPNCTTMQLMVALKPILDAAGIERLIVSTYQSVSGTGRQRDRGAARASPRRCSTASRPRPGGLSPPGRLQRAAAGRDLQGRRRLHDRGAQGDGGDAQDPRALRGGRDLGHLRPRPGGHRPLGVGQRPDRAGTSRRRSAASCSPRPGPGRARRSRATASTRCRSPPRAGTRSWSAGSAATPRTSAASTSGWSATTCARARRPTPSRSPSCFTSGTSFAFPPARA